MPDPWFKFFTSDWRSDPCLRMCGPAARGLWIELMCLMHEAQPYGHLFVNGHRPTDAQLAVLTGIPSDQLPGLLGELESAGVFSRTGKGAIYSRRMTRDEKKRRTARKNGRAGGNPSLRKGEGNSTSDNPPVKTHIPEARDQKEKGDANASPKKTPRKRAARLPADWQLPKAWGEWALANTPLSADQIRQEAEKMRNWSQYAAKGACKDWLARWRNWCLAASQHPPSPPPRGGRHERASVTDIAEFFGSQDRAEAEEGMAGGEGKDVSRALLGAGSATRR